MPEILDRIEKEVLIKAAPERVWRAITDSKEFGEWFEADFFGQPFVAGQRVKGKITTLGYSDFDMDILVERMEPPRLFSYRWHPYDGDREADRSHEPTTLVEFILEPAGEGTRLRIVESGFAAIPPDKWERAYRGNEEGWAEQAERVRKYVDG